MSAPERHGNEPDAAIEPEAVMNIGVSVNGSVQQMPAGSTVAQLLQHLGHAPNRIATAVNGEFVARAARAERRLNDGDQLHCFQPIGGG